VRRVVRPGWRCESACQEQRVKIHAEKEGFAEPVPPPQVEV
jgi:hypothetical protein